MALKNGSLEQLGWRQGSVITTQECSLIEAIPDPGKDIFVVAPYSCAVVNSDFQNKEPILELIRFREVQAEAALQKGRNPRTIQLKVLNEKALLFFNASIHDRYFVAHNILEGSSPSQKYRINDEQTKILSHWLAKRYTRNVLPSEFNRRAEKGMRYLRDQLKKIYTKNQDDIDFLEGVYVSLDPDDKELTDIEEPYDVSVVFLMSEQGRVLIPDFVEPLKKTFIEKLSNCDGICVNEGRSEIQSETGMSISEYRALIRLDDYDFYSA